MTSLGSKNAFVGVPLATIQMGFLRHLTASLNTKNPYLERELNAPKSPFKWLHVGPPKRDFLTPKMSFPAFPILTSVGGPLDRNARNCSCKEHGGKLAAARLSSRGHPPKTK